MAKETDKSTPKSSDYDMIKCTPSKESDIDHHQTTCPNQNSRQNIWSLILLAVTIGIVMSACTRVSRQSDANYDGALLQNNNVHLSNYDMDFSDEYDGVGKKGSTDKWEDGYDEDEWKFADLDLGDLLNRHDKSGKSKSGKRSKGKSDKSKSGKRSKGKSGKSDKRSKGKSGKSDKRSKGKSGKSDKRSKGKSGKSDKHSKGKSDKHSKGKSDKHSKGKSGKHDKSKSRKHDKSKSGKHGKSGKENFSSSLDSSSSSESWSSSFDSDE